jgi:hypothetical protein
MRRARRPQSNLHAISDKKYRLLIDVRAPVAALAAMLFQHPHIGHHHAAVDRLAHVVDRQQADLHRGQRFHFPPGLAEGFDLRAATHAVGPAANF